ncbi:MAG: toll/interleukin-1 receptor domain-containing protein [Conexivisphaerales archaeon]
MCLDMGVEDPIIDLIKSGYYPDIIKINEGFSPSFNETLSRVYLRKGAHAVIVPAGYEWFAINYYNLKNIAQKIPLTVFLSYPREDLWLAYKVQKILSEVGIFVYLAELFPEPGVTLWEKIKEMIERSNIVIVLWTKSAKNSAFVNQEIGYANKANKLVIPLVEKGAVPEGALAGLEYVPFEKGRDTEALSSLCNALYNFLLRKIEDQRKQQAQQAATLIGGAILVLSFIALLAAFGGKKQ